MDCYHPRAYPVQRFPVANLFVAPLCSHNRFLGTLAVLRGDPEEAFSQEEQVFYLDLADRVAMAIENVNFFLAEQRKAREMGSLYEATQSLLETEGRAVSLDLERRSKAILAMENGIRIGLPPIR
jgi:GAF domain-containing protein